MACPDHRRFADRWVRLVHPSAGHGAGIAASNKPDAMRIRALNIIGHLVFGFGLLMAARMVTFI